MLSVGWSPANIAIIDISLKTRFLGLHFRCGKYWRIFNHFYVIRPEIYRIPWNYVDITAITPFKVIQGHRFWYQSKAHMRLSILVINCNLPPILHRLRDIALERSKIAINYLATPLWFNPPPEGFPWDDLHKIFMERSQMAKVPNGVETLPKISIAWVGCTNVTDDRQTDGRAMIYKNGNDADTYVIHSVSHLCGIAITHTHSTRRLDL